MPRSKDDLVDKTQKQGDKIFSEYEIARKSEEGRAQRYADFLVGVGDATQTRKDTTDKVAKEKGRG